MSLQTDSVVDEFLVMQCQNGDRNALSTLVTKWQPVFLRYAAFMTRNDDLASDAVQDAWIKIIKSLPGLSDPLKFQRWAYRIIHNQCLDALRKQRPTEQANEDEQVRPFQHLETEDQVLVTLAQLTPEHRGVLALHYLQGFDIKEIAAIVRKPEGTVKSRLFNAREKFREFLAVSTDNEHTEGENHERTGCQDSGSPLVSNHTT